MYKNFNMGALWPQSNSLLSLESRSLSFVRRDSKRSAAQDIFTARVAGKILGAKRSLRRMEGRGEQEESIFSLCKACEQLVYTAWQKPVGKLPQPVWKALASDIIIRTIVDKLPTYAIFPPPPSTNLPTYFEQLSYLLHRHLPTVSTQLTTTTTNIYNKRNA